MARTVTVTISTSETSVGHHRARVTMNAELNKKAPSRTTCSLGESRMCSTMWSPGDHQPPESFEPVGSMVLTCSPDASTTARDVLRLLALDAKKAGRRLCSQGHLGQTSVEITRSCACGPKNGTVRVCCERLGRWWPRLGGRLGGRTGPTAQTSGLVGRPERVKMSH